MLTATKQWNTISMIPVLMGTHGQAQNRPAEPSADNVLLKDIQLLMLQKQQAILLNPNDHASAKQVPILQQVRSHMSCSSFVLNPLSLHRTSRCERKQKEAKEEKKKKRQKKQKERRERCHVSLAVVVEDSYKELSSPTPA